MEELVRVCPFCSSDSIEYQMGCMPEVHFYHCMVCDADGPVAETDEAALEAWNTRAYGPDCLQDIDLEEDAFVGDFYRD